MELEYYPKLKKKMLMGLSGFMNGGFEFMKCNIQ